jgi:hypothetical protein
MTKVIISLYGIQNHPQTTELWLHALTVRHSPRQS